MAQEKAVDQPPPVPGRLRSALLVLRGERLVPVQLQAEWLTYQQIFDDVLTRLGAQLARQAKLQKEQLVRYLQENPESEGDSYSSGDLAERKNAIRRRFAERGQLRPQLQPHRSSAVQPEESP